MFCLSLTIPFLSFVKFVFIFIWHEKGLVNNPYKKFTMLSLYEHAGWEQAHDPHMWWIFDARETSPKTCPLCLTLHGHQFRGDGLNMAFPYHIHLRVNAIKAMVHPHCRCVLRWAGRTEQIYKTAVVGGLAKRKVKSLPQKQKVKAGRLSPFLKRQKKAIMRYGE